MKVIVAAVWRARVTSASAMRTLSPLAAAASPATAVAALA